MRSGVELPPWGRWSGGTQYDLRQSYAKSALRPGIHWPELFAHALCLFVVTCLVFLGHAVGVVRSVGVACCPSLRLAVVVSCFR